MNVLAHLTAVESPSLAIAYALGIVTGIVVSLALVHLRTR